jgi:hypothetical protein
LAWGELEIDRIRAVLAQPHAASWDMDDSKKPLRIFTRLLLISLMHSLRWLVERVEHRPGMNIYKNISDNKNIFQPVPRCGLSSVQRAQYEYTYILI